MYSKKENSKGEQRQVIGKSVVQRRNVKRRFEILDNRPKSVEIRRDNVKFFGQTLQERPLVQRRIDPRVAGAYEGFTQDNQYLPTLYFEYGHLTQQHDTQENEGWHHNLSAFTYRRNIPKQVAKETQELIDKVDFKAFKYLSDIADHVYDSHDPNDEIVNFEIFFMDPKRNSFNYHISRSFMEPPGPSSLIPNQVYDDAYAQNALSTANVAANAREKELAMYRARIVAVEADYEGEVADYAGEEAEGDLARQIPEKTGNSNFNVLRS